ncbi:hypothetical protein F5Y08DRAFT_308363 [Xylaria arbuscula]|nr:hypothetical protein F5Y08DRAFT_308363 [Xylaria arbuscula]
MCIIKMDWLRSDDSVWDKNMAILNFVPAKSTALVISKQRKDELRGQEYTLRSEDDWQEWLDQHTLQSYVPTTMKLNLILAARGDTGPFDPAVLSCLPFSENMFRKLIRQFKIHGTIVRTINRNTSCAFIRKFHSWDHSNERSIVYNCRSSASWDGDLALSVTFTPHNLTTNAVLYGCDSKATEDISRRLLGSDLSSLHPMVLVVLFAELERDRLDKLVRKRINRLVQQIVGISENNDCVLNADHKSLPPLNLSLTTSIRDWLEMRELCNGIQAFKRKMCDMTEHINEFQKLLNPKRDKHGFARSLHPDTLNSLEVTGRKMKERLKHLIDEFDEHIRKCADIVDIVKIASQLEWNQIGRRDTVTNLDIAQNGLKVAQHTRRDSELMKSIALLTMVFLPATFVATLFSMGIFEWKGTRGEILRVSPYIWLYVAVTVAITSLTLGAWYLWVVRRAASSRTLNTNKDVEAQQQGGTENGEGSGAERTLSEKGTFSTASSRSSS